MTTISNPPTKKVFTIDLKNLPTKEEIENSLRYLMRNHWLIEYERKQLIKKRKEKIMKLNGFTTFYNC